MASGTSAIWLGPGSVYQVTASCAPSGDQAMVSTASSAGPGVGSARRPLPSAAFISHSTGKVEALSETNAICLPSGDQVGRRFQSLFSRMVDCESVSRSGSHRARR